MLRVALVGGGPSAPCAAEVLARAGIKTWIFERKLDNAKPCGGAIPLCMVEEFFGDVFHPCGQVGDAGVVDHDVDMAHLADRRFDHVGHLIAV